MGWAGGEGTAVDVHWQDPSPKPKSPVVQRVTPLSEAAEERLYTTARQVVRTRRGPSVDKAERTRGFGSSSPSRTGPGSRLHADDSREPVVGLAKKRDSPVASPTQKLTTAVSVRKAPDSVSTPDVEPSKPPSPTNKASINRRNSKRKTKIDSTKNRDESDKDLYGVPLLAAAERPTAAVAGVGAALLDSDDVARDATDSPIIVASNVSSQEKEQPEDNPEGVRQAEQAPDLEVDPGAQLEVELEPEPEPEPEQQSGDDVSGPGKYRVLATTTVRKEADTTSKKVGEFNKGTVIDVVHVVKSCNGLTMLQTVTAPNGKRHGGWVKSVTSKGKVLLEFLGPVPNPALTRSEQSESLVQAAVHPKRDDPILLPQSGEVEPDSDLEEPSPVRAPSAARVADPVDEKVRKAILGEAIAAATQDEVLLDEEDIVEVELDDGNPRRATTEHTAGERLLVADNLSSDELLSRMENFLNFDSAVDSADNALDSTEAWATHYAHNTPEPDKAVEAAPASPDLQPSTTPERATTITISVMCPLDYELGHPVTIDTDYGPVVVTAPAGVEPGDMFEAEVAVHNDGVTTELREDRPSPVGSLEDLYGQMQAAGSPQPTDDGESAREAKAIGDASEEERFRAEQNALGLGSFSSSDSGDEQPQQLQQPPLETEEIEVDDQNHRRISVVCPDDVLPGQDLVVEGPDGREILIQIPSGVTAGDEFEVDVSAVDTLMAVSSAQTMTVVVPAGIGGGESMIVELPDGRELEVVVPDGVIAGEEFEFEFE